MELMEVLEYYDNSGTVLVQKVPQNGTSEIKWGAQLTIAESQEAVFFRDGKALDVFKAGRHVLKTQNIPLVGKWVTSFGYGPTSPFRAEVFFVGKQLFPNLKWGTHEPILFRDTEFKMIRLRSFGIFSIQVADSLLFVNKLVGTQRLYTTFDIEKYLKNIILSRLTSILSENLVSIFDLPSKFDDINLITRTKLQAEFDALGLYLHDFYISSVSVPEDVQKIIDQKSGMHAIGDLNEFMKYKIALSLENASKNSGGTGDLLGGGLGAGMGLGLGLLFPQFIQQSMNPSQSDSTKSNTSSTVVDQLKSLKELFDLKIISEVEYNEKRNKLLEKI